MKQAKKTNNQKQSKPVKPTKKKPPVAVTLSAKPRPKQPQPTVATTSKVPKSKESFNGVPTVSNPVPTQSIPKTIKAVTGTLLGTSMSSQASSTSTIASKKESAASHSTQQLQHEYELPSTAEDTGLKSVSNDEECHNFNLGVEMGTRSITSVIEVIKSDIFKHVKQLANQHELDDLSQGSFGYTIMAKLNIHPNQQAGFWSAVKSGAYAHLTKFRQGVSTRLKHAFYSKWIERCSIIDV